ncbi:MAG: pilus assembly protein TadG-related protein [Bryobacteraceae bacterium]
MCRVAPTRPKEHGFVLIAMSVCIFFLLAVIGLVFDLGRIYITRNEAQVFTDAASMAAAKELDGTPAGIQRAKASVASLPNRWNLGSQAFEGVVTEFSIDGQHWEPQPRDSSMLRFARVTAPDNNVEILFLRAVGGPVNFTVPAYAVATTNPVRLTE